MVYSGPLAFGAADTRAFDELAHSHGFAAAAAAAGVNSDFNCWYSIENVAHKNGPGLIRKFCFRSRQIFPKTPKVPFNARKI